MALQWIVGDFKTGAFTTNRVLPAILSTSQEVSHDIHAIDEATLTLSKRALPSPAAFETHLQPGQRMVALEDTSVAWDAPGRILYAGVIMRITSKPKDVIKLRINGVREWLSRRVITSTLTGSVPDPTLGVAFTGATYRDAIIALYRHAFAGASGTTGVPTIFNAFPTPAPGGLGATFLNSNFMDYSNALDEIAQLGPGNEVTHRWAWTSSAMTTMKFTLAVGTDSQPFINYDATPIQLNISDETAKVVMYGQTLSMDGSATRLISQSKAGDEKEKTGSDFNAIIKTSTTQRVLWDQTFNPGIELSAAQMTAQTSSRLDFALTKRGDAELTVVGDRQQWLARLGRKINITADASPDFSGYSITVRLVEVNFSDSNNVVKLKIQPLQARFPKLPKKDKSPNKNKGGQGGNSGFGNAGGFDTTMPILPRPKPNQPPPGGGGGGINPPTFEPPVWEASKPFFVNLKPTVTNMPGSGGAQTGEINTFPVGDTSSVVVMRPSAWSSTFGATPGEQQTHASAADCETYFNTSTRMKMGANTSPSNPNSIDYFNLQRVTYSKTAAPVVTPLFQFNIADHFTTWTEWQNGKTLASLYSYRGGDNLDHSIEKFAHEATITGVMFIHDSDVFLWIHSTRSISKLRSNIQDVTGSITSTRLYKNALDGSSSTWELVGQDLKDEEGRIFFPYSNNSIVSSRSGLYIYGGLRVDNNGLSGYVGNIEQISIEEASFETPIGSDVVYPDPLLISVQQPYYDGDLLKLTGATLSREPQYQAIPDLSITERASLAQTPSYGYGPPYVNSLKREELSTSAPRLKYFAKRSGRAQSVAVFQLPAWNIREGVETPDESDFSPDAYTQMSIFTGNTTGNLSKYIEFLESSEYYKVTGRTTPIPLFIDGWYVLLYYDTTNSTSPGWWSLRTKGSGGAWIKAFESNITNLRMGGRALGSGGWRGREGYSIQTSTAPTFMETLSGPSLTSFGNYGILTSKEAGNRIALQSIGFEIDGTL